MKTTVKFNPKFADEIIKALAGYNSLSKVLDVTFQAEKKDPKDKKLTDISMIIESENESAINDFISEIELYLD